MSDTLSMMNLRLSEAASLLGLPAPEADPVIQRVGIDSRAAEAGDLFIALRGVRFNGHDFLAEVKAAGAVAAIVDHVVEDVDLPQLLVSDTHEALTRLAAGWRNRFTLKVIGVTGSNGKTSVKEMLRTVLGRKAPVYATRGNLNNDIGVPLNLLGLRSHHAFAVIEMGASAPREIDQLSRLVRPDVAVITNASAAHLAGFGTVKAVARAKGEIFAGLGPNGVAVINHDDPNIGTWWHMIGNHPHIGFALHSDAEVRAECIQLNGLQGSRFLLVTPSGSVEVRLALPGEHNVANALAVAAAAHACGFSPDAIAGGLAAVKGVPGRLQVHHLGCGAILIDDCYNANPRSLSAAIRVLKSSGRKRCWLVLGDMGELGACDLSMHAQVGREAGMEGVERLYALGPLSEAAVDAFAGHGWVFRDHAELTRALQDDLTASLAPDEVVILVKGSRSSHMEHVIRPLLADSESVDAQGLEAAGMSTNNGGPTCCSM